VKADMTADMLTLYWRIVTF